MTSGREELPRIIDKRQSITGIEYLVSTTGEWVPSSSSRCINPDLVELYEWLKKSGYREGTTVFAETPQPKKLTARHARKRTTSAAISKVAGEVDPLTGNAQAGIIVASGVELETEDSSRETIVVKEEDKVDKSNDTRPPLNKRQRMDNFSIEISQLSIDTPAPEAASPTTLASTSPSMTERPKVLEFNRNTEQMIEVYFKEGLDATGVEMFDTLLGPYRRPKKEFIASFFYAVLLSPLVEVTTIEAAIHVLDRTLTIHGPDPFQHLWDVQKRRRELLDGVNPFLMPFNQKEDSGITSHTRSNNSGASTNRGDLSSGPSTMWRLPGWNDMWDLVKGLLGLDNKPESRQYISLQERQIRARLRVEVRPKSGLESKQRDVDESDGDAEEYSQTIPAEQIIREEAGRKIVGFLLRVLEQDAVIKNLSRMSFFYRHVLSVDPYSPALPVRQALDVVFQMVGLSCTARFLERIPPTNDLTLSSRAKKLKYAPWPLEERSKMTSAGLEIMNLGQQLLLLLIRFTQAGELLPGKGMEELARETLSRVVKVNKGHERKQGASTSFPTTPSSASSFSAAALSFAPQSLWADRTSLDMTEIFLKTLIQGPVLLDSGTGSGASVKLRKEDTIKDQLGDGSSGSVSYDFDPDSGLYAAVGEYNGVLKSQTGICMGSCSFVMILVDLWFRTKTLAAPNKSGNFSLANIHLNLHRAVEQYSMPCLVRSNVVVVPAPSVPKIERASTRRGQSAAAAAAAKNKEMVEDINLESIALADLGPEQWHPKDLEQIEWTVVMMEILFQAWIEARGIRRDEIAGTGLESVLFPEDSVASQTQGESGWLAMSKLLDSIGETIKWRWELLEQVIEAAIMIEDLRLR